MKRVYDSKEPSIKTLQNIAENLRKHLETYVQVTVGAYSSHRSGFAYVEYGIYIESDSQAIYTFRDWSEALRFYRSLIKRRRKP